MGISKGFLSCFVGSSSSSSARVADNRVAEGKAENMKLESSKKSKSKASSSAPIVVYHFPHHSYLSRL